MLEIYAIKFENKWLMYNRGWSDELNLYCLWMNKQIATDTIIDIEKGQLVTLIIEERPLRGPQTKKGIKKDKF